MKKFSQIQLIFILLIISIACKRNLHFPNIPPVAMAGNDTTIVLPTNQLPLDGSKSYDPEGKALSFSWKILSGASASITNPQNKITSITNLVAGKHQIELTVGKQSENLNTLYAKDTISITVNATPININHAPVANAGKDDVIQLPTDSVILNGKDSYDPDNDIKSYYWKRLSGNDSCHIISSNSMSTIVTNLKQGVYQFELTVTDLVGLFSTDTLKVTVNKAPAPRLPNAYAGPDLIITLPLDSTYLDGHYGYVSDKYTWTQISGPSTSFIKPLNLNPPLGSNWDTANRVAKNLIPGIYLFKLEVSNQYGIAYDTLKITVIDDPLEKNTIVIKDLVWQNGWVFPGDFYPFIFGPFLPTICSDFQNLKTNFSAYVQLDNSTTWEEVKAAKTNSGYWYYNYMRYLVVESCINNISLKGKKVTMKIKLL